MGDDPPDALVQRMAATFQKSDGDIAATRTALDQAVSAAGRNTLFLSAPDFIRG